MGFYYHVVPAVRCIKQGYDGGKVVVPLFPVDGCRVSCWGGGVGGGGQWIQLASTYMQYNLV